MTLHSRGFAVEVTMIFWRSSSTEIDPSRQRTDVRYPITAPVAMLELRYTGQR